MSSDNQTLILAGEGYSLAIAPDAVAQKSEILKHSALIVEVTGPEANEAARNQIKKLAAMRNAVEKSRKIVKEPVLQVGRDIDTKAKDFVAEIEAEEKRVGGLLAKYAEEVERERLRIAREMEAKRIAEEKARREAEEARLKAEREAEEARLKDQEAEWEDDEETKRKTAEEAAKREAEAIAAKAAAEEAAKVTPVVEMVPAKASGVKFAPEFEVENIHALYAYSTALVDMTPKRREILETINKFMEQNGGELPAIPGLRVFKKPVVSTR